MNQSPRLLAVFKAENNRIPGSYIVTLKPDSDLQSHIDSMQQRAHQHPTPAQFQVLNQYNMIGAYFAKVSESVLDDLTRREDVNSITEEREGTLDDELDVE